MATPTKYYIPLEKPILLFFPSVTESEVDPSTTKKKADWNFAGYTVQISVKQAHRYDIKEMMAFFHAQDEISKAIESVVFAHIIASLPVEIRIQGKDYTLKGKRKAWKLGKTLHLAWGDRPIRPCDDKWTFIFELLESPQSD